MVLMKIVVEEKSSPDIKDGKKKTIGRKSP